ncbi:tRNA(Met) cytidine acetyltransferase [Erwinia endophytica]|uniref:tRNA(Met) cytidine acetyltransferase TmcA n=1 Tax=Erwinia endophytica TaxID=1563158 RepID=UPI001265EFB5|nr:GNAT family N-acetyltransferase [Erwinia endophytica]KAB8309558.1 tRNA(Met) cytidine acetyltransferase [Erwinia endophytica]
MAEVSEKIIAHTAALKRQGMRQMLVISGEAVWCLQQAEQWMALLAGDWLWLGNIPYRKPHCAPHAVRTLLGQEFLHAVFDAREGFNADALAALSGTLKAGSWLLLLVPAWQNWPSQPDTDSLRWSETDSPIPTPNFVHRLQRLMQQDPQVAILRQHFPLQLPALPPTSDWQPDDRSQQQRLLDELIASQPGIFVLIAPRGRGKSALAGLLAARWPGRILITAPAKASTEVLAKFAGEAFTFMAPDQLLARSLSPCLPDIDWLLIDEAAAIPAPLLHKLVRLAPRVLLTTTHQGYEGTGRGFLLKFCASLPDATVLKLDQPLRWSPHDPLERFVDNALLFTEAEPLSGQAAIDYCFPLQADWHTTPQVNEGMYQLLASAHYRTSPLDLRRMMDAPGMHFSAALQGETVQGALWLVDEGGLSEMLAQAVWAGLRRPGGNLVAQSLAAHAGWPEAARMRSRRISRIAISPALRRCGMGREMVRQSQERAEGLDFLSVSFGYTSSLWRFWQACGFRLVRLGCKPEASSGCYTAMALLPLSAQGQALADRAADRLARDWPWLQRFVAGVSLELPLTRHDDELDEYDWRELAGFAWAHRPFEASIGALGRLVNLWQGLPLLQGILLNRLTPAALCQQFGLTGRKALLAGWRQEVRQALDALDASRSADWQRCIKSLN